MLSGSLKRMVPRHEVSVRRKRVWTVIGSPGRVGGWIFNELEPAMRPGDPTTVETLVRLSKTSCLGTMRFKEPLSIEVVEKLLHRAQGVTVP